MMKFKYTIVFMIFHFITSCSGQDNLTEKALKVCINESLNNNIEERTGKSIFDFYAMIIEVENKLIAANLISYNDNDGYLRLIKSITKSKKPEYEKMYLQQSEIMDKYGFTPFSTETVFNQCPYKVSANVKDAEGKHIYNQGRILNKLMAEGYDNDELIEELINSVDENNFKKVVYRAPIILLTMIKLDKEYNPNYERLEEYQKGKQPSLDDKN